MKMMRIGMALFLLFLTGAGIFSWYLVKHEEKYKTQDFLNKGNHLVSLIALHSMQELEGGRRDLIVRTLMEYTSQAGFVYLFVNDPTGRPAVSVAPPGMAAQIPAEILSKSQSTLELTSQSFQAGGAGPRIYEFAKPIFEGPQRTGIVRLGMRAPVVSVFSPERLSLLAILAFFIFGGVTFGYYGIVLLLKPLRSLSQGLKLSDGDPGAFHKSPGSADIGPVVRDLEASLRSIHDRMRQMESDNLDLLSRLSVTTFERNQIVHILDSISFGIIITDLQENVLHINDYMLKLMGKKREDVLDRPLQKILDNEVLLGFISGQDYPGEPGGGHQMETPLPDWAPGETYRVSLSYLRSSEKIPTGKMVFIQNVTAESYAEKTQQDFIAHVAHELQTPLTNIKLYSEMLMDGEVQDPETQKEYYNVINEQTNRLTSIIRNLLNLSKMQMGSLTLNKGLVKTDWFAEDCVQAVEAAAHDKGITIEKSMPDSFPTLIADKELLRTAVINILGNAVKYTPPGGRVTFSIDEKDRMVVFDVDDTGYGISEEDLPHVFEKFYRSGDQNIADKTGSGLGLAITKEIVHLHGGTIQVESTLGKGTRFTIRVPREDYYLGKT